MLPSTLKPISCNKLLRVGAKQDGGYVISKKIFIFKESKSSTKAFSISYCPPKPFKEVFKPKKFINCMIKSVY